MSSYFIESFEIRKLWGYRDINVRFQRDVNILIGVNGCGKTTILNLLHAILSPDLRSVLDVRFDEAVIKLRGVTGNSVRTVKVKVDLEDRILKLSVGRTRINLDIDFILGRRDPRYYRHPETGQIVRRMPPRPSSRGRKVPELTLTELTALVPIVWLPVSRRFPETDAEEERHPRTETAEWVDRRLKNLLSNLSQYHSRLNARLSERYKEFEHQVLSAILYSKEEDQLDSIRESIRDSMVHLSSTDAEKEQLRSAFEVAGLLDEQMEMRINDHFAAAEEVLKRINENADWALKDILVLPIIGRTKAMVEYAGELEEDREQIFSPLRLYEETVNSFLNDKSASVDESGNLKIESASSSDLDTQFLSSGEKQILILLTQALLEVDQPVIYIADEPELSLHVSWQEKLLESLVTLGQQTQAPSSNQMQIIVATHSPDIVGKIQDKVLDLGRNN